MSTGRGLLSKKTWPSGDQRPSISSSRGLPVATPGYSSDDRETTTQQVGAFLHSCELFIHL